MEFLKFSYLAASMPDYWELSFKTSMLSLHNRTIRSHILVQIGDDISLYLELTGIKGNTACCLGPDTDGMIHVIVGESAFLNLFHGEVTGQLVDDGGYHFQMPQFISA